MFGVKRMENNEKILNQEIGKLKEKRKNIHLANLKRNWPTRVFGNSLGLLLVFAIYFAFRGIGNIISNISDLSTLETINFTMTGAFWVNAIVTMVIVNIPDFYYDKKELEALENINKNIDELTDKLSIEVNKRLEQERIKNERIRQEKRNRRKAQIQKVISFFKEIYRFTKEKFQKKNALKEAERNKYNNISDNNKYGPTINLLKNETLDEYHKRVEQLLAKGEDVYFSKIFEENGKEEGIKSIIVGGYNIYDYDELAEIIMSLYISNFLNIKDIETILIAFYYRRNASKEKNKNILLTLCKDYGLELKSLKRVLIEVCKNGLLDEFDLENILLEAYQNGLLVEEDIDKILNSIKKVLTNNEPVLAIRKTNQDTFSNKQRRGR